MLRPFRHDSPKIRRERKPIRSMTVCVAAIAAESRAIVMIADKMITRGDMVSDTSICKMSRIGQTPWCAMIAGVIATADEVLMRTAIELQKSPKDVEEEYSMMK